MLKATMVAWSKASHPRGLRWIVPQSLFLEYLLICGADKGLSEKLKLYSNYTVKQTKTNKQTNIWNSGF